MRYAHTIVIASALALLIGCSVPEGDASTTATADMAMDAAERLPGTAVEARTVSAGTLVGTIEASGLIRGVQEAWVISETQGVIESVELTLGDAVLEDAPLVTFDPSLQELQLRQAQAQLDSARLDLAATERLYNGGNASMADLARARSAAAGAEAAVESARRAAANRTIRAPISGRIAEMADDVTRGNYLGTGSRVARIIDTERLRVEIALGEGEIGYVQRGSRAMVSVPACGEGPVEAAVVGVAAASEEATGSFPVTVEWANTCGNRVKAGMSARVAIVPSVEPTLIVPATAVLNRDGSSYVFIEEDGTARRRQVTLGNRSGNAVQVTDGLSAGERIITSGLARLVDRSAVTVTVIGETGAL